MATSDDRSDRPEGDEPASDASADLSDELVEKWDPERLLGVVSKRAGRGDALDQSLRNKYERRFGVDLSHVRVYTGEFAESVARQRNAYAVTVGTTGMIMMGNSPDKSMASAAGEALLAHELVHAGVQTKRAMQNSDDRPFAKGSSEEEAHQVEHSVLEEAKGAPKHDAHVAEYYEHVKSRVKERVKEMLAEAGRIQEIRNGKGPRRP